MDTQYVTAELCGGKSGVSFPNSPLPEMDPFRPPTRRRTVLVVEDDAPLREFYQRTLALAGYVVVAVEDGIDALRRIDAGLVPSAVVLDLGLPRLNGFDVESELRSRADTGMIPIIVVTGINDPRGFSDHQFSCVLQKPVAPEAIIYALEEYLRQSAPSSLV